MLRTHRVADSIRKALPAAVAVAMSTAPWSLAAQAGNGGTRSAGTGPGSVPAAMSSIREADLKRDLYAMAGPEMRGREAGTLDEMRASIWVADQLRKIGVAPGAPDGTYFQWFNMRRTRVSSVSSNAFVGKSLALWTDIIPNANVSSTVVGRTVWAGDGRDTTIDVRGKVVIAQITGPTNQVRPEGTNSYEYRYAASAINAASTRFQRRGALGVILVADSITDIAFDGVAALRSRGTYDVVGGMPRNGPPRADATQRIGPPPTPQAPMPVYLVRRAMLSALQNGGDSVNLQTRIETFESPSVNIIGVIKGTDAALRNEYLLYSSHQDHDGVRYTIAGDSTWSGADDNGTVSVALFAIARAFVKQPGKRPVMFVYHGAEERGLLGSRYHAQHPVVPIENIVAVLNGDMIGRNNPDSASLLGIQPPHRNSSDLVAMALRANDLTGKFKLDSIWDRPTHPEGWYFRSDHVPYARRNVPAIEYSTNLHADYHTPRDKPENIDYAKLTRMTQWMYLTGWFVANAAKRPGVDAGFQLER